MANINDILKKTRAIKEKEDTLLVAQFHKQYAAIRRVFTFNKSWHRNWADAMARVIYDPEWRLMMAHGEVAKIVGPRGERIIALGTHYGTVLVYSLYDSDNSLVRYVVTQAFADAWERGYGKKVNLDDYIDMKAPHFFDTNFFDHVNEIATGDRELGIAVGDGIPLYKPAPKAKPEYKAKPFQQKRAVPSNNNAVYS